MWTMLWPLLVVILSNTFYNISQKSIPQNANTFGTLMITYIVAAVCTGIAFITTTKPQNAIPELSKINWTAFALGLAIVGLEIGYLFIYRAGWKISTATAVANILVSCLLIVVGAMIYKEVITPRQLAGMVVCVIGIALITK
ncbi:MULTISPECIES: EamA family transporter [Peptoniphilus]|uniref:EamA family transporter n=1 Tax=Peptoniphilus TaxID=162289 RepID=UPI0001DA9FC7|nr:MULTISPECIES: EamA family transporter [Peptoniphilus]EFI41579.1 putative membrane protein [Peptoniphilus sp. oral taxon 386 str. F0131]